MFTNDIYADIQPPHSGKIQIVGSKLPSNRDIFFYAKWNELFERYESARLFLRKAQDEKYDDWFSPMENDEDKHIFDLYIKSQLYEAALFNYNIIVDLSWTWTYVSAEYVLYKYDSDGKIINQNEINMLCPIDVAYDKLRKEEKNVVSPGVISSPFSYLKYMCPEYRGAIELITDFWRSISETDIRMNYNYTKHRGVLLYEEIENFSSDRIWSFYNGTEQLPSDIKDVRRIVSLSDSINNLIDFDDHCLFPYICQLISELKKAVNPSPFVI